jgi:hypothetical protein
MASTMKISFLLLMIVLINLIQAKFSDVPRKLILLKLTDHLINFYRSTTKTSRTFSFKRRIEKVFTKGICSNREDEFEHNLSFFLGS